MITRIPCILAITIAISLLFSGQAAAIDNIPPTVAFTEFAEDSEYLHAVNSTRTIYYSNQMPADCQFTIIIDAEDTDSGLDKAVGPTIFGDSPVDDTEGARPNVYQISYSINSTVTDAGSYQIYVYDVAGNYSDVSFTVIKDFTPPTVTSTPDREPNANGWYNNDVTVSFSAVDGGAGVASVDSPVTISSEGSDQIATGFATDNVGNRGANSLSINIDKTPPNSAVDPLPSEIKDTYTFIVSWSGSDSLTNIVSYDVETNDNGSGWVVWLDNTDIVSAEFTGEEDHNYLFKSVATDLAGNQEIKSLADTQTLVNLDSDNDGIPDSEDTDDDDDGMPDEWEVTYGFDPLVNNASEDPDEDGSTNLVEYQNGSDPTVANIPQAQREALVAFYNSTDGDNWAHNSGWKAQPLHSDGFAMPGTEDGWYGITCDGENKNVVQIYLAYKQLTGSIPSELGNLTNLTILALRNNQLSGSIPIELGNLASLNHLDLASNQLVGSIPSEIANLRYLSDLTLDYNATYSNDEDLLTFLNNLDPDWLSTQTLAPEDVTIDSATESTVVVQWAPVAYTTDPGKYIISYSTFPDGPYTVFGTTTDKSVTQMRVTGLDIDTSYYFVVKTQTDPHTNNQNTVVSDYSEEVSATTIFDADSDGMSNDWEITYFGDTSRDGTLDYDSDNLSDLEEYQSETDPTLEDTDSDGMPDGWEIQYNLNPLVNDTSLDPDNDGYSNLDEYKERTNPNDPSDQPFPWEIFYPAFIKKSLDNNDS